MPQYVREIYSDYTDEIEAFGIDENWLSMTASTKLFGDGKSIADTIRNRVTEELGLTVSIGVSFNKIFAKLGRDLRKPNYTNIISRDNYKEVAWKLPVSDLLYVGKATNKKLRSHSIQTIGDLANYDVNLLQSMLGKWGVVLHQFANGRDTSEVKKIGTESFIKSVGNSLTAKRDLTTIEDIKAMFYMLSDSVASRLREHKLKCSGVQISIRDNGLMSCERQEMLVRPTFISSEIAEKAMDIFHNKYKFTKPIRSVGVRGINLVSKDMPLQLDLFNDHEKQHKLELVEQVVDEIRDRFGYHSIKKGILLIDKELTNVDAKSDHVIHPVNFFDGTLF